MDNLRLSSCYFSAIFKKVCHNFSLTLPQKMQSAMNSKSFLFALLLWIPIKSFGFGYPSDFTVGVGNITQFVGKVQTDTAGGTNGFEFSPYLNFGLELPLPFFKLSILPQLGLLIPKDGRDKRINKFEYFIIGDIGRHFSDFLIRLGAGLFMTNINSDGGTQELQNGNTTTAFYMPSRSYTARNLILDLGVEYMPHKKWSVRTEALVFNAEDSLDRAFSYTISFHYHFSDIFDGLFKKEVPSPKTKEPSNEPKESPKS